MSQKSALPAIPFEWQPKYYLKRIGEEDILIDQPTRDNVLNALAGSQKFVQIGEYTIMLNAIKSIDPFWEPANIPPRPKVLIAREIEAQIYGETASLEADKNKQKMWDELFGASNYKALLEDSYV